MSVESCFQHIEKVAGEPARLKRAPRIRVAQLAMDYLAHGWSVDEMCRQHPYLSLAEAHAAMAYYFDHQGEIDAEIRREFIESTEGRQRATDSPVVMRLRAQGKL